MKSEHRSEVELLIYDAYRKTSSNIEAIKASIEDLQRQLVDECADLRELNLDTDEMTETQVDEYAEKLASLGLIEYSR
jgi:hypothetical protein